MGSDRARALTVGGPLRTQGQEPETCGWVSPALDSGLPRGDLPASSRSLHLISRGRLDFAVQLARSPEIVLAGPRSPEIPVLFGEESVVKQESLLNNGAVDLLKSLSGLPGTLRS